MKYVTVQWLETEGFREAPEIFSMHDDADLSAAIDLIFDHHLDGYERNWKYNIPDCWRDCGKVVVTDNEGVEVAFVGESEVTPIHTL